LKSLKLLILIFGILYNYAYGQIVTPSLDASVLSLMPATAGWRDQTNFNGSFETFSETDFEGNKSKISDVSYMVSSQLLYNVYQESFSSTKNVDKKYSSNFTGLDEKSKTERTKFNVAVGFGQPLPGNSHRFFIGFSYFSGRIDEEMNTSTTSWVCPVDEVKPYSWSTYTYCPTQRVAQTTEGASNTLNVKETGMGLGISYNLWQLLYISYGIQRTTTTDGDVFLTVNSSSTNYRYLGNSWLDKFYGFSIKSTKPGVPKFRLEWSFIQSPSSTNEAGGQSSSNTTVKTNEHDRYEILIRNMEFSPTNMNNWIFFLHLKQNKIFKRFSTTWGDFQNMTDEQISSGFYWSYPGQKGLSIGLRYMDSKRFLNTSSTNALGEKLQVSSGKGNRFSIDYRF
tara:strand:+ start:503 stop:1690 length:1188 start_codon:yes stop_codon:yes gene_type:complete